MFGWLKNVLNNVKNLNTTIDTYEKDTVIQSLPSLTYVNRAKKMIDIGKYEQAETILLKALELPQEDALVYKYLGAVYEKTGKNNLAVENYQKSADLEPNDKIIWQRLGFALLSCKKNEQAEKAFENANKIFQNCSDNYTGLGMALMRQEKYAQARESFCQATAIDKYNFIALFLCAVVEVELEMYDKAEMKLKFLSSVSPNESNTYEYAKLLYIKKDYDNAIFYAKKSIDFNPSMLPAYVLLGQLYAEKYDRESSSKFFKIAEEKGMQDSEFYFKWGKALLLLNDYKQALLKFTKSLDSACYLALCYALNKEFDKAWEIINDLKDTESLVVKKAQGILKYEYCDYDSAISLLRADEKDSTNCYYLAKCYEKLNNHTKTRDYYEAAITICPDFCEAYVDYSKYLIARNEYKEAQRKLRKAVKNDENNTTLLNLLFNVSYILVKDDLCEYNVKETINIAEKIENINPDLFEYPEQKAELIQLLQHMKEK